MYVDTCNMHEDEYKVARFRIRNFPLNAVIYFSLQTFTVLLQVQHYLPVNIGSLVFEITTNWQ